MMKRFLSSIDTFNKWVGVIFGYLVLVMIGINTFEVISRFAFNNPTIWAHETTTQLFGFYMVIGGGYVLYRKRHLRVDFLWSRYSLRGKAIADVATCGFAFLFLGILLQFSIRMAVDAIRILERSSTPFSPPVYPLQIGLVIAVSLLIIQLVVKTIRDLHTVITGGEDV